MKYCTVAVCTRWSLCIIFTFIFRCSKPGCSSLNLIKTWSTMAKSLFVWIGNNIFESWKQKTFGKLILGSCPSLEWLNKTFQLLCSLMKEGWMPQEVAKMTFCQFLKTFVFSVKCHLHSAWKHLKSKDPAHEHHFPLTFRYTVVVDISGLHQLLVQTIKFPNDSVDNPNPIPCSHFTEDFFLAGLRGNFLTPTLLDLAVILLS